MLATKLLTTLNLKILLALLIVSGYALQSFAQRNLRHANKLTASEDVYFNAEGRTVAQPNTLAADKVSATSIGSVLTLLYDDAKLSLQNESDPLIASWTGTILVPIRSTSAPRPKSYLQHLRGFVGKEKDSSVTIILELGGKTHLISFPYGVKVNRNIIRELISPVQSHSQSYVATLMIVVERRSAKNAVQVNIESLDIDARGARVKKK